MRLLCVYIMRGNRREPRRSHCEEEAGSQAAEERFALANLVGAGFPPAAQIKFPMYQCTSTLIHWDEGRE
ncbi:hypothetical protein CL629_04225 [bacterium]|nr:hypothetical protein [bacterium]